MENFLPALLIIGGVIYKIYTEYQKEQEKAQARIPRKQPHPAPQPPTARTTAARPVPAPVQVQKPVPHPFRHETVKSSTIPEEVQRVRQRKEEDRKKVKAPVEQETYQPAFDLREAVIHAAILNRPYQ